MDIARSMMQPAVNSGVQPLSLDNKLGQRARAQTHKWTFTGTVGTGTDQAPFYNILTDVAESGNTLGSPAPAQSGWSAAAVARFIADNPAPLVNMHFTGATTSTLLEGGVLTFVRKTPAGAQNVHDEQMSTFTSSMRYQPTILSIPIEGEVFDGYTYVRVKTAQATPTANGYNLTFTFGGTNDKRAEVPEAQAMVVRE